MKRKKMSKKGVLSMAVLWTVATVLWAATAFWRTFEGADGIDVLTILTLLATAAASIANWYRYANYSE